MAAQYTLHQVVVFALCSCLVACAVQCTIQLDVVFALCIVQLHCAVGWLRVLQPNFFFNPIPAADIQVLFAVA